MSHNDQSHAKDFFLHLGLIVSLYTSVIALVNLLFKIINVSFPQVDAYARYYYSYQTGSPISIQVAILIVFFPIFLYLSRVVGRAYKKYPAMRDFVVRKWLLYITLFITGLVFAGDLVTVLYFFLDGKELTAGFLLKALTVLVVIGGVYVYYLKDLRDTLSDKARHLSGIFMTMLVVVSIILGFIVTGSPQTQRLIRYDAQTVQDLQSIAGNIEVFYQNTGELPETLAEADDFSLERTIRTQQNTKDSYVYNILGPDTYELCATFNLATTDDASRAYEDKWFHTEGLSCFTRRVYSLEKPLPVEYPLPF